MQKNFSYPLRVDDISSAERNYKIKANTEQLKQIAEVLKVSEVKDFSADIKVCRQTKKTVIDVWGKVEALITRQSVISLENFDKKYESAFVLQFDTLMTENKIRELEEEGVDNIPDVVTGGQIDLGHLAIEQIALELEDYPRQKGEEFVFVSEFDEATNKTENPFKILEKLKK